MPYNELIFLAHTSLVSTFLLVCVRLGQPALVSIVCFLPVLANFLVLKQTTLFGFTATCADAYAIGATLGLNLLNEYYGKQVAQRTVLISFMLLIFYTLMTIVHGLYLPATTDSAHLHYCALLQFMPRLTIASLITYTIVNYFNIGLYTALKKYTGKHLLTRNYISIMISHLVDTVLFSFFGLYDIVENIGSIIVISYSIKLATLLIATPFVGWSKKLSAKKS
jgi:uncharacterized integral membrane protein (TIGR00697 family)